MIAPEILINFVPVSRLYDSMQPSYDQISCFVKHKKIALSKPCVFHTFFSIPQDAESQQEAKPFIFVVSIEFSAKNRSEWRGQTSKILDFKNIDFFDSPCPPLHIYVK